MRRPSLGISLIGSSAIAAAIIVVTVGYDCPVDMNIVNTSEVGAAKEVTVEFRRRNPAVRFSKDQCLQARIAGRWQPPEPFPPVVDTYLLARTNREQIVFTVPCQTEACRFLLGYRIGPRPDCQVGSFLERHGLFKRFPKFSHAVLKCVPKQPRLRHVECELSVFAETHGKIVQAIRDPASQSSGSEWFANGFPAAVAEPVRSATK